MQTTQVYVQGTVVQSIISRSKWCTQSDFHYGILCQYQSSGCYAAFEAVLKPLLEYEDLKPEVSEWMKPLQETFAMSS